MDIGLVFRQSDPVLMGAFIVLLLMSLASWTLIFGRGVALYRAWRAVDADAAQAAQGPRQQLSEVGAEALRRHQAHPKSLWAQELSVDEAVARALRGWLQRERGRLDAGLGWLATVGSTAPFVGLFGTVWGVYHALVDISAQGQASIGTVAGPIGEALVATAAGLAAAVPAVAAYNAFVRNSRALSARHEELADAVHAQLLTQTPAGARHGD